MWRKINWSSKRAGLGSWGGAAWRPFMPPILDTRFWYHDLIGQSVQNNDDRLLMLRDDEAEC